VGGILKLLHLSVLYLIEIYGFICIVFNNSLNNKFSTLNNLVLQM